MSPSSEPDALLNTAVAVHRQGRPEAAILLYRTALGSFSDARARHSAGLWLASALCDIDRLEEAVSACVDAIAECPDSYVGFAMLAGIAFELGRLDEADEAVEAALIRTPDDRESRNLATGIALARGRPALAAVADRAAMCLSFAPTDQRALAHRIVALAQLDGHADAAAELKLLLDFDQLLRASAIAAAPGFASVDDFNAALSLAIRASHQLDRRHLGKTLVGGARLHDCFTLEPKLVTALRGLFSHAVRAYVEELSIDEHHPVRIGCPNNLDPTMSWANLMEQSAYERPHIHDGSWLSGVYYVEVPMAGPAPSLEGAVEFDGHDYDAALASTGPIRG
jgi:hypothetical protein